jgi:hypothetical protein
MAQCSYGLVRVVACGLCFAVCLLSIGCGEPKETVPELVSVTGKVTFRGQPLADASVTFIPAEGDEEPTELNRLVRPSAKTDADGGYELAWGDNPGAPPGKYNVTVMKLAPSEDDEVKPASLIPENYGSPKTSGLMKVVKDGDNVINIELQ